MNCGTCAEARRNSKDGVYCRMYGIVIRSGHEGCKYYKGASRSDDRGNRDGLDAAGEQQQARR